MQITPRSNIREIKWLLAWGSGKREVKTFGFAG